MARLVAIYKKPGEVDAFEKHYFGTHIPLAKTMPGFRKYEVSYGPVSVLAGPTDVYLIGTVYFDDLEAMNKAFASPEGRATAADRQLYAPDGHRRPNLHFRRSGGLNHATQSSFCPSPRRVAQPISVGQGDTHT